MELHDILLAADVVEYRFPPKNLEDVMTLVASLNLLNAAVKIPLGREVTTYRYIKGHVAVLFVWLFFHPIEGVDIYYDNEEGIAYFNVPGYQFSFHRVPFMTLFLSQFRKLVPQKWNGLQLQPIAVEVFQSISNQKKMLSNYSCDELVNIMCSCSLKDIRSKLSDISGFDLLISQKKSGNMMNKNSKIQDKIEYPYKISRDKIRSLCLAIKFNGFNYMEYEHYRTGDPYGIIVVCYDGCNYERMMHLFYGKKTRKMFPENQLEVGKHYYLDRSNMQLKALTLEQHCTLRINYPNLIFYNKCFPLCITYNIAVYISKFFPDLHFVNLLNYNDCDIEKQIYTADSLELEPQDSRARHEKVWIVIDENNSLKKCNVWAIPKELFEEYKNKPDYTDVTIAK
jgi:hypothetical protein